MDGVLFRGDRALPGAGDFLTWLRGRDIRFQLLTNNSTGTPEANVEKLSRMGIEVEPDDILTSAQATGMFLTEQHPTGGRAVVIGEEGLLKAVAQAGLQIIDGPQGADWVISGLDRSVTYDKLRRAALAIEAGARFVATNADSSLPVPEGLIPGAGALQAAITATTGATPTIIGKPEARMLELAIKRLRAEPARTAMLGDRLDTDVEAARRAGIRSILVLTGVTTREQLEGSSLQPTAVFEDLGQLMTEWQEAHVRKAS